MLKIESLNGEEEVLTLELEQRGRGWIAESLKLESLNKRVFLDYRDLKSEELNLKWVLGRRDREKKYFNKILEIVGLET